MSGCDHYQELISSLIDRELTDEEDRALQEHMAECEDCRAMYAFMSGMSDSLNDSLEDLPEGLHENIMAQVRRQAIREKNRPRQIWRVVASTAAIAVLVVGVVLATGAGRMGGAQSSMAALSRMDTAESRPEAVMEAPAEAAEEAVPAEEPESAVGAAYDADFAYAPVEGLRDFLQGEPAESVTGEITEVVEAQGERFELYEVDGTLFYRDPADGQFYRSDKSLDQVRDYLHG